MVAPSIVDGILIGGAGGAVAGLVLTLVNWLVKVQSERADKSTIYVWLSENSENKNGKRFRSTRAIASWNNLTEDRVRYICSIHESIFLSTGPETDLWSIHNRSEATPWDEGSGSGQVNL